MKNPKTNEHRNNTFLKAVVFGIIGFMLLFTIAMYGMEAKATDQSAKHRAKIEEIDRSRSARKAAREQEWAEARQELHEYFSRQKMEENRTSIEEFQASDVDLQEEIDQVVTPLAIVVLEERTQMSTEVEMRTLENIVEVTEDDIKEIEVFFEKPANVSAKVEMIEAEQKKAEIKLIEAEPEPEETEIKGDDDWFETDWFEPQPKVETQPKVENVPEPTVASVPVAATTPIVYQDNSNANESLKNFLKHNGMTLEDFIIRMTCMVYPEACGEDFIGKQGVAEVALNWIYSGLKTEWWDLSSGFANISVQRYFELKWDPLTMDVLAECEQAVRSVIDGAHPVEDMLGVKPYYFLLPEKSDPINVYVMLQATYQIWIGNQLYLGMEGIDWTQKTN